MNLLRVTGRLVVPSVLLAATLPASSFAVAAAPMCQGQEATIVGAPHESLQGTAGRDVIVTNGAVTTQAGAGDDLVCVTGPVEASPSVHAGEGDDEVRVEVSGGLVFIVLGRGADGFTGGSGIDSVVAGEVGRTAVDGDRDVIDTGAGDDWVVSGDDANPVLDRITTGDGDDQITTRGVGMAGDALLDAGPDRDQLTVDGDVPSGDWRFDSAISSAQEDGVPRLAWAGVEDFDLDLTARSVAFVGTDGPERLEGDAVTRASMGGGDDDVELLPTGRSGAHYDAGDGVDRLVMDGEQVTADLRTGRVELASRVATVSGFDSIEVAAERAVIRGGPSDDRFDVFACKVRASGGQGDDQYDVMYVHESYPCFRGDHWFRGGPGDDKAKGGLGSDVLSGGSGRDVLRGERSRDRLVGGAGDDLLVGGQNQADRAIGGPGRDVCRRAERRSSCERR